MSIPVITTVFDPPILGTDTDQVFSDKVDVMFGTDLPDFVDQLNDFAPDLVAEATSFFTALSASSVLIGTGTKDFDVDTGKAFKADQFIKFTDDADSSRWMFGTIATYDTSNGFLEADITQTAGAGTPTFWKVTISGPPGPTGATLPNMAGNAGKIAVVNSGATDLEYVDDGFVLIGTLTPSAASTSTFSSIPQTYRELLMRIEGLSASVSGNYRIAVSPDGVSFSSPLNISASNTAANSGKGGLEIPKYTEDSGGMAGGISGGFSTSPSAFSGAVGVAWACTGGIQAIRLDNSSGTITGTIKLYGRR